MILALAKWLLRGSDYHVHFNPGKHPETRKKLNGAVSKNMDKYALQGFEDYEEERENADIRDDWQIGRGSCKGTGGNPRRDKRSGKPLL